MCSLRRWMKMTNLYLYKDQEKREKIQITKIWNEIGDITTYSTEIKKN